MGNVDAIKPRKRINPISKRRAAQLREYAKAKREWWADMLALFGAGHITCAFPGCTSVPDKTPHHIRGRMGSLLCDRRFWVRVCAKHHTWIHQNPEEARKLGLLCKKGLWNTPDRT